MPLRKLPDGTYLVKPPSNNLCVVRAEPSGTIVYSGIPGRLPITFSPALPTDNLPRLLIIP